MTTTYRIDLPWDKPRLSPNLRLHWAERARLTRTARDSTAWLARKLHLHNVPHVTVQLHHRPATRRRLDADNLCMDQKACCDGIVDAGIVSDDTPALMTKPMPVIHQPGTPAMWLEITVSDTPKELPA